MYEAEKWHNEMAYHSPKVIGSNELNIFAGDLVMCRLEIGLLCAKIIILIL